ncbi:Altronate dehydratase [termite gut metagenome]|uniref:Altronate dehydratase n=1 Tax=termite gut metagenome TaxID=433724 RepID=A0A5J4SYW8_9ZZZZ
MRKYVQLNGDDNVIVALLPFHKDDVLKLGETMITILNDIPSGHKIAVKDIRKRESVIKYGFSIGQALVDITVGEHVHVHNITSE